jgi:hypothetical protein
MKKTLLSLLFILPACNQTTYKIKNLTFVTIGSQNASQSWIYLCGLTTDFVPNQMNELKTLDTIGKELNIKILAIIPHHRCPQYNHRLCWPHKNKKELLNTYKEIMNSVNTQTIHGYIGFSNGGFFLTQLAQHIPLHKPIITIGSAGLIKNIHGPDNTIHLLIGKQDQWHYEYAINLYNQSKNTHLTIDLVEYNGGHEIPIDILKNVLKKIMVELHNQYIPLNIPIPNKK